MGVGERRVGAGFHESILEGLRRRAREAPDRVVFTFLADGEVESGSLTYRDLERQTRSLAAMLRERLEPGDRALLIYPPGLEFIPAFLGCLSAGVVAVPVHPPRPNDRSPARLRSIVCDAEPRAVLTTAGFLAGGARDPRAAVPSLERALWWATDEAGPDGDLPEFPEPSPDDLAFLQYTSGSTSEPKGVLVTHANLAHNERMIGAAFAQDESSLVVGWLPLFHDMGLIGQVLQPLWAGARCVLMSPAAFLQKPVRWLAAISRHQATTSGGPNFAYELCAAKIPPEALGDLDLSSWRLAFNGAEPVRASTLGRFAEKFAPCGFRRAAFHPCYGLAEATLFVSGGSSGPEPCLMQVDAAALEHHEISVAEGSAARTLVSSGRAWLDERIAVADPQTGEECSAGMVGEIWVAGPSVARGYWRQPEATERDFHAFLCARDGERSGPFLRTGDLGFLRDDELYVTGRLKDLIILRGRNHYPQDLESTSEQSHRELSAGGGAAFPVDVEGEERLVIVHEIGRHPRDTPEEIAAAVRRAVAEEHEIQVQEVVLIRAGSLPRTTSGKVRRRASRSAYLAGSLAVVGRSALSAAPAGTAAPVPDPTMLAALGPLDRRDLLEPFVRERAAAALGLAATAVGPSQPLTTLGLDSLSALQLRGTLETALTVAVPFDDLLAGARVRDLVDRISAELEARVGRAEEVQEAVERTPPDARPQPLSPGQKGLWLVDRLAPAEAALNLAVAARAHGLDPDPFRRALGRVVGRHEALRTVFELRGDEPIQREQESVVPDLRIEATAGWSDERLALRLDEEAWAPFDLENGPLLRVRLFARGDGDWLLLWVIHHLVADFWSLAQVARELAALYREECGGPAAVLSRADAAPRPADHARWLARRLTGPRADRLWSFWQQQLAGLADLDLQTDRPRPKVQTWRGSAVSRRLPTALAERLHELGRAGSATPFMTLLAAFQAQLGRYSGQEAFAVGSPVAGRSRPELEGLVGYLVNPLPLCTDLTGDPTFLELLQRVRGTVVAALDHGEFPFPWMAERLGRARGASRPPLYQALFVLQRGRPQDDPGLAAFALGEEGMRIGLGGIALESMRLARRRVQVEVALWAAFDAAGGLLLALETNSDLFETATAERLLGHLATFLEGAVETPQTPLWHLPLLTPAELGQLAVDGATATPERLDGRCLHELFEEQVERTPEAEAVVAGDVRLTYRELERRANRLGHLLRGMGVLPESRVGVCLFRSERMVEAVLGVLKAGGAYVPLDPAYPRERLELMLVDSGASIVVTESRVEAGLPFLAERELPRIRLDADAARLTSESDLRPAMLTGPHHLAYLIYTSGSTGRPKAVAIEHRSPVARVRWAGESFGPEELAGVLAATSLCFDLSIFEIFVPLGYGGCVIVAADALALRSLPASREVTLVNTVPSAMAELIRAEAVPTSVRTINLAGEPIPPGLASAILALRPELRLWNLYGPSEDTTYSTGARLSPGGGTPIGRPLAGTSVRLLDAHGELVPRGFAGEIYLGGAGLARGYLGRPELTAERFLPNPYGEPGARLYRTGDLARYRSEGELDYLGRIDHQIKIRGFRVELGEVEAALATHPAVAEVVAGASGGPDARLVAWVVPAVGVAPRGPELAAWLRARLPEPLVPTAWTLLSELPRQPNGKVDRRALLTQGELSPSTAVWKAPRTPIEEVLAGIWAELLSCGRVGADDDFWDLGGHSLLAVRVIARARAAFGVDLPLRTLFERRTLAALGARIEEERRRETLPAPPIRRWSGGRPAPLSFGQEGMWLDDRLNPGRGTYNLPGVLRLRGPLEAPALDRAWAEVVRRHEVLRTRFAEDGEAGVQIAVPPAAGPLPQIDLAALPAAARESVALRVARDEARLPVDLATGPVVRARLIRLGAADHLLVVVLHHAVADGWSLGILTEELSVLYGALRRREVSPLPEPQLQFADYAAWQRDWLRGEVLERLLAYWRRELAGLAPRLDLPSDRLRLPVPSFRGDFLPVHLGVAEVSALHVLARRTGTTLFMVLLGGFHALLGRYAGVLDVAVGTPTANRSRGELEGLIGLFVNTLVLRGRLDGAPSGEELLARTRWAALGAYEHQEMPFERLVAELTPERTSAHAPLVQVLLTLQSYPAPSPAFPDLEVERIELSSGSSRFDLSFLLEEANGELHGGLEHSRDLFDEPSVMRLLESWRTLLAGLAAAPEGRVAELPLLTLAERGALLAEHVPAPVPWASQRNALLHELVVAQAERTPDATAVVGEDGNLTYGELVDCAGALAERLQDAGVGPDAVIGLCAEPGLEMVVGLLAILSAGGAFLPLDSSYPPDRLALMLEDAGVSVLVAQEPLPAGLRTGGRRVIPLEGSLTARPAKAGGASSRGTPDQGAYVLYTSGSTGRPKGVVVPHRGVVNRLLAEPWGFGLGPSDAMLHKAPVGFDASVYSTFAPLVTGARVVLARPGGHRDPAYLWRLMAEQEITHVEFVPSLLELFLAEIPAGACLPALRWVFAGGEALSPALRDRFFTLLEASLENEYGPTEASIDVVWWACQHEDREARVPIGRPIPGCTAVVLEPGGEPAPMGVTGELSLGGVCLARGYLGRPDLTAERFVPDPFGEAGGRLYRTGDLSRRRPDHALEYLGRSDQQVKIHGVRIEPGEIEAVLRSHPAVCDAVVAVHHDASGDRLVGYVVTEEPAPRPGELRNLLAASLPDAMIPSAFVPLAALPLNSNGKLDRAALPAPPRPDRPSARLRTPIEELLAGIWESVLGLDRVGGQVGPHDRFFDVGGHSLAAARVATRIRETFHVELPLRAIFEAPSLEDLARTVEAAAPGWAAWADDPVLEPTVDDGPTPLAPAQERFWFLDRLTPGSPDYNILVALELRGHLRVAALAAGLASLVCRHDALRTIFALGEDGPVQWAAPVWEPPLPVADVSGLPEEAGAGETLRRAREEAERPFDLSGGRLLRALLIRRGEGDHLFLAVTHHIAFDGSYELFLRELAALYANPEAMAPPRVVRTVDVARWERRRLSGHLLERQLAYWRGRLGSDAPALELPFDRQRPPVRTGHGGSVPLAFPAALRGALRDLARRQGATLYMILLAGFQALLHKYTEQVVIRVGSPVVLRPRRELESVIGCFTNTLVLSCELTPELTGSELLARARSAALEAFTCRDLPFEMLVRELQPERDLSRTPLFQTMLSHTTPLEAAGLELPGLTVSFPRIPLTRARFDLLLGVWEGVGEGLAGDVEYDRELFDPPTVLRLVEHYRILLAGLAAQPERRIAQQPLLTDGELHQVTVGWNDTEREVARDLCLHELFEMRAALAPAAVAVASAEDEWTYGELERRANCLAWRLIELGAAHGAPVGIHLERTPALVAALLAAHKAGMHYVPLETALPAARLALMAAAAGVRHVITQRSLAQRVAAWDGGSRHLVLAEEADAPGGGGAPGRRAGPDEPAYVIFTSGSTGTPKGVVVRHRPVVNLIDWVNRTFDLGSADRALFLTSPGFDLSVYDVFGLLAAGGCVRVVANWELAEPQCLLEILCRERVTFWNSAPAALQRLEPFFATAETGRSQLRLVFLSGDWIPVGLPDTIRRAFPPAAVVSLGGATEATVWSNAYPVGAVDPAWVSIPYGRPIQNARYHVLNGDLRPCPIGVAGGLYVGGPCLADGYADEPTLTAAAFLPDPFAARAGGRLYQTGDRARFRPDGNLEFLGRRDHQVKIRGHRIELGEIEAVLIAHPRVREAVVVARPDRTGGKRLVAYVVPHGEAPAVADLIALVRRRLPEAMIPSAFFVLDALPLTANDKVDRKALPDPADTGAPAGGSATPTPVEELLALLWAEVLGLERDVGVAEDFFALGGHSLLAARLTARVRQTLGVDLPLRDLFEAPTPAGLARRAEELLRDGRSVPPLEKAPRDTEPPLSFAQERLWVLERLAPGNAAYHIPAALRIAGPLDASALARSLGEIVRRHEVLRTRLVRWDDLPRQVVDPPSNQRPLARVDIAGCPEGVREDELLRLAASEAQSPFDLESGPLFRTVLLRLGGTDHVLLTTMHHAVSDGPSVEILIRELATIYAAFSAGEPSPLKEPALQYVDFAVWQRRRLPEIEAVQLAHWRECLCGAPPLLELPTDRPRPLLESFRGCSLSFPVSAASELATVAAHAGVTRFMAWLALFQVFLARASRQGDILVGIPFANRDRTEIADLIGLFVNTLVIRTEVRRGSTVRELLGRVREAALRAYAHADLPFERLLEELQPERSLSHHPIFQVLFALERDPEDLLRHVPGLELRLLPQTSSTARLDLALTLTEGAAGATATLEYRTDLFDGSTAHRMLGHLASLASAAAADPDQPLGRLPLLSSAERQQLAAWSFAPTAALPGALVHHFIAARAATFPDALALTSGAERLSYGELERRANRLAHRLRHLGVGPETRVGVCLDRSLAAVVTLLAIFKAGGAYVPLDPAYPVERLAFLVEDAGISQVVTESRYAERLPVPHGAAVVLDADAAAIATEDAAELTEAAGAHTLAYIIYTSGSTGRPKGVAIEHGCLSAVLVGALQELGFCAGDSIPGIAPFSFDISVLEVIGPLLAGGTCRLLPERPLDLRRLLALMEESTFFHAVPALMRQVVGAVREEVRVAPARFARLRNLLVGGDRVPPDLVEDLRRTFPAARVRILYGPTETTIVCASYLVMASEAVDRALLGRPLPGVVLRLYDEDLEPVPPGMVGELFVGGVGVGRGYWNRDGLTRERFIERAGERFYRTGDLARHLPDGSLEFLGRTDYEVKIRGFRIDPGEIEAALREHPAVQEAAAVALEDGNGDRRLVAYVVPVAEESFLTRHLRAYLAERLPDHMVPSLFVVLEALPLTPHGKVDHRALPAPDGGRPESGEPFVAPSTFLERVLTAIWAEVLGVSRVGVHDDFFQLGGHSLLATQVMARIRKQLGIELPLRHLFELRTVARLAGALAEGVGEDLPAPPPLEPALRPGPAPLSFAQERLWFLDRMDPGSSLYNVSDLFRLEGDLPLGALERALTAVVRRHEALRTRFAEVDGEPVQVVMPPSAWRLPVVDLSRLPAVPREAEIGRVAAREAWRPFDLVTSPLLRSVILEAGESGRALLFATHHIVSDAWSMRVLVRDLAGLLGGGSGEPPLPPLSVQYADYAIWQRSWLTGDALAARLSYWRCQLAGAPPALALPSDRPRPAVQTFRGALEPVALSPVLTAAVGELARREGATPFVVLLAVFQTLLFRLTGEPDFCVGSPVSGRGQCETEGLIGLFVNTLVLRADLGWHLSFREVLARAREVSVAAQVHQDVPLEMLIAELQPQRDLSHSPLFQILFGFHSVPRSFELSGTRLTSLPLPAPTAKFDLSLLLSDADGTVEGGLEYNTDLFEAVTLRRVAGQLWRLLEAALASPEQPAADLALLSGSEAHQLLIEWSATAPASAGSGLLHELFEAQVLRTPDAEALVDGALRITYRELAERADLLALRLRHLGVGPEIRVGVCCRRTAAMVAALLGVLKAGGAYLPLDPAYPAERLAFTLADSRAAVILTQRELRDLLPETEAPILCLDGDAFAPGAPDLAPSTVLPGNLAYVIYTSGSTGRPKGVAIEHRSAVAFMGWAGEAFTAADMASVLASTSICFDLSVFEIFAPLVRGGAIILAADALALPGLPAAAEVTLINTVPSAAAELARLRGLPSSARVINLAGEPLRRDLVDTLYATSDVRVVLNLYGPSEATTYSTLAVISRDDWRAPSIGWPIAGTRTLVLDAGLRPVPAGVTGELLLGGAGLARGYLDWPELTAELFVPDLSGPSGERLYRTGDLVRHRPDGSLDFLGRRDHQVKVRGFRIEMGEIEVALARHSAVREALVIAAELGAAGFGLTAYVVPAAGTAPARGELREHLRRTLPEHMVPADFVLLQAIPRTPNGKVDRRALPAPDRRRPAADGAVLTPMEEIVADAWAEILGVPAVRGGDDFFELGGHSLLATRVVSRLQERLGIELPLRALFQHPTVASLALEAERKLAAGGGPSLPPIERLPRGEGPLPLSFAQERLWFFDRLEPGSPIYNINGVFGLRGPLDVPALAAGLRAVVCRHESLRTRFMERGQVILTPMEIPLPQIDLRALPVAVRETEIQRRTVAEARLPFDLTRGLLLRALLLELGNEHHLLAVTLHHIACDGWSLGVLIRELLELYAAGVAGRAPDLPDLPIQYADFARWQRQWLQGEALEEQLAYWTRHLDGAPSQLALPFDRPRPLWPTYRGGAHRFTVCPEVTAALKVLGRGEGATLFMILLAAWGILLQSYSGQSDIVVGTGIANRHRRSLQGLIGLLTNTVALRIALAGDPTVGELLARVREVVFGAHAHQDLPFEKLVEALRPERDVSYHPIFQVMLVLQEAAPKLSSAAGLDLSPVAIDHGSAKFDLTLFAFEEDDGIAAVLEYDADLFEAGTIADLAAQLMALLEALPAWAGEPISALRFVSFSQEESLLGPFAEDLEL